MPLNNTAIIPKIIVNHKHTLHNNNTSPERLRPSAMKYGRNANIRIIGSSREGCRLSAICLVNYIQVQQHTIAHQYTISIPTSALHIASAAPMSAEQPNISKNFPSDFRSITNVPSLVA